MLDLLAFLLGGFVLGWMVRGVMCHRALAAVQESWQQRVDDLRAELLGLRREP